MYKIIGKSYIWLISSIVLSIFSVIFIAAFGLRLGIDYKGGTVIQIKSSSSESIKITEEIVKGQSFEDYQIKPAANNEVILKLPALSNDQHLTLKDQFNQKLPDFSETSYDTVGPSISSDLTKRSVIAVVLASLGIIIYIAWAFKKVPKPLSSWKFGLCAVIAVIHDLLITTGIVALLGKFLPWMEVDVLFITALLTIMGFSVHDTIVVYDRLRENFIHNPHQDIKLTTEESVNQTLVRSLNTSLTVFIVLVTLFIVGGGAIKHFVLTLVIGVFFGTYSSIFIASALVALWHKNKVGLKI